MPRIIMEYVGKVAGVDAYAPADAEAEKAINGQGVIVCDVKGERAKRTHLQNASMHKYFELLSTALNDAGLDMRLVMDKLSDNAEIPWSPLAVKERLWRPTQIHTYGEKSTAKLETNHVSVIYEALNRALSNELEMTGIPFPDKYSLMDSKNGE